MMNPRSLFYRQTHSQKQDDADVSSLYPDTHKRYDDDGRVSYHYQKDEQGESTTRTFLKLDKKTKE